MVPPAQRDGCRSAPAFLSRTRSNFVSQTVEPRNSTAAPAASGSRTSNNDLERVRSVLEEREHQTLAPLWLILGVTPIREFRHYRPTTAPANTESTLPHQQGYGEPKPKRGSKEFMRRKLTRREESAHDRACGCNPQGDAEGPDHPFPVLRNAAIPNVPEPQPQEDQEQDGKQGRGGGFVYTANRHRVAHHE